VSTHDDGAVARQAEVLGGVGGDGRGRDEQALAPLAMVGALPRRSSMVDAK
jgi:hypothetical protein